MHQSLTGVLACLAIMIPPFIMSSIPSSSTSRLNVDSIFNTALQAYKEKTGQDITAHPLANELQSCRSPDAILAVLRTQVPSFDQSQSSDGRWLIPTVNALYAFSATVGEGVGLVNRTKSHLIEIIRSNICLSGILSGESNFCRDWRSPPGRPHSDPLSSLF